MRNDSGPAIAIVRTIVLWGAALYLLYRICEAITPALFTLGLALFLAIVLDGPIRRLDRRGLSRAASVGIIIAGLLAALTIGVLVSVRPIVAEIRDVSENAPAYARSIEARIQGLTGRYPYLEHRLEDGDVGKWMGDAGKRLAAQIGRFSVGVLGGMFTGLIVLVTALYTVLDPKPLVRGTVMAAPARYRRLILRIVVGISRQVQAWARATVWLMVIVGVACGLGLWAIGVRSALLFGVLAGIGEAIPTIGPILTAIPPALVALADEPAKALWVLGLFLAVQQLEQHLLVPRIMAAALRLHPVSVLFFVVALGGLLGPLGVLLATPLCAAVKVAYREIRADAERRRETLDAADGTAA